MTATASGPATARRSSAAPRGSMADTRRPVSARVNEASRAWTSSRRKARLNGPRWRACCAPSSESMLGPTTLAVEKRGSSTVNVRASRRTSTARSYPVTSQAPRAGTQLTGAAARSRASAGCGSASRSASVTRSAGVFGAGTLTTGARGVSARFRAAVGEDGHQDPPGHENQPEVHQAVRVHRHQLLTGRCYHGVRLGLGRGVDPVGPGSRSAQVGPGTDELVGIMDKIPRPCYETYGRWPESQVIAGGAALAR